MKNKIREFIYHRYNISFSKSGDDIQLMKLINNRKPGTYIDIGCWHPVKSSNTYHFYVRNWRGICIDPNPELKPLYQKIRPKDTFINCGIGTSEGSLDYYMLNESASSMNTFDYSFITSKGLEQNVEKTLQIPIYSLERILDENLRADERLDFFDIDVEGLDLQVLQSNNWEKYRPQFIVIETDLPLADDIHSENIQYLMQQDYSLVAKSVINGDLGNLFLINNRQK